MGVPGVWADCSTCMFVGGGGCVTVARQDHTSQKWTGNSAERSACVPLCWCSCEVQRALCDRLGTGSAVVSGCVTLTVTLTLCVCECLSTALHSHRGQASSSGSS